jgi:hypothetical protein
MMTQLKIRIALLSSLFIAGLFGLPAAAPSSAATTGAPLAATQARLFWYVPRLDTNSAPQRINSLAFDPAEPGVALAAEFNSYGVLLRTLDHGMTWSKITSWNPDDLAMLPRVMYGGQPHTFYAWSGSLLYKSTDAGTSWNALPYDRTCNAITTLAVHPSNPSILYAGTPYGFVQSLDGGQTWRGTNQFFCDGGPQAFVIGIGVDRPNVVYAGVFDNYGSVARSADQGATWEWVPISQPQADGGYVGGVIRLLVDSRNADVLYALTSFGKVYKTTNGGAQWTLFVQGIETVQISAMVFDPTNHNRIYAASTDHIYSVADGTPAWQILDTEPIPQTSSSPHINGLQIDPAASRPIAYNDYAIFVGLPIPSATALSPATAPAGTREFTLTVEGSDFTPATLVRWNGQERPTTFVSDTRLTTTISATDVLTTGTVPITVGYHRYYNYASDGASNALPFTIQPACAANGQLVPSGPCGVTITPSEASTLVYTSTSSLVTEIVVPASSVTATTVLSYTAVPTATAPAGFGFAGLAFSLDAYQDDIKLDGFAFAQPIGVTVQYSDADIAGLNEQTLTLAYWNGTGWVDAGTTCAPPSIYTHEPEMNRFTVAICHLSEFGVFGVPQRKLLLPLMRR